MAVAAAAIFTWLGLVLGLSLIEAPLKFRAPGITRELGLGIGRLVFKTLNVCELLLVLIALVALFADDTKRSVWWTFVPLLAIAVVQAVMIHTAMDKRAARIVQGETLPESRQHVIYIVLEVVKVVLLIATGTFLLRSLAG
ncbi:MAG: hypothetical protein QM589_05945 [Thermomicrobiales bacterium]